jgi:ATP-dependent RNA circularization protein (DNA/RNA ligase family)
MAEKAANCKLLTERLGLWSAKNIKKFNSLENIHEEVEVNANPKEYITQLKGYLERLSNSIEQVTIPEEKTAVDAKVTLGGSNLRIQLNPKEEHVDPPKVQCNFFPI